MFSIVAQSTDRIERIEQAYRDATAANEQVIALGAAFIVVSAIVLGFIAWRVWTAKGGESMD